VEKRGKRKSFIAKGNEALSGPNYGLGEEGRERTNHLTNRHITHKHNDKLPSPLFKKLVRFRPSIYSFLCSAQLLQSSLLKNCHIAYAIMPQGELSCRERGSETIIEASGIMCNC
jgi:hypothetical protein